MTTTITAPELGATVPVDCRRTVEKLTGSPTTWEEKTDRGGAVVWKVTGPQGMWAAKVGRVEGAAVVARESAVMERIGGAAPATSYSARAQWGRAEALAWLVTPWLDGASTWELFQDVRDKRGNYEEPLQAAVDLCTAVGQLHQAGWVHSDLQPHHAIHMPGGVRLIDCSWAWNMSLPPSSGYGGGLVHFMSPELMQRIEKGERPVATSQPDEVYALAASLWWAATNTWPLDYRAAGIDPATFPVIELRRLRLRHRIPLGSITHWPELGEVLGQVLTTHPSQRPTALQLAQWLRSINPREVRIG